MTTALPDSLRRHGLPILCLVLIPTLIGLIHDDWLYTPITYLDPWYNVGFFLHYFDPAFLPGHYKESRLSWLAPGYLAYKAFGPVAANFILHIGSLVTAGVFVYLTLARLTSRNAALIAAGLLLAYYPFHNSGGWDYQTHPSGAYFALTLYLLTRAAQSARPGAWLVGAGAAFGAAFHADILFVNMAPVLAAHYLVVTRNERSVKAIATVAGWSLLGFVILTQVLMMVAWSAGRNPMFFKPIVDIVFNYTMDPQTHMSQWWLSPSTGWFLEKYYLRYLAVPAGIFVAGLVWLAGWAWTLRTPEGRKAGLAGDRVIRAFLIGQFLFLLLLWIVWQFLGHVALQPDYFAYPLIIPAFIALGALIGTAGWRALAFLGVTLLAVLLASLTRPANAALMPLAPALWLLFGAMVAAIVAGSLSAKARPAAVIAAAGVFLATYHVLSPGNEWSQLRRLAGSCSGPGHMFKELVRYNLALWTEGGGAPRAWIWNGPVTPVDSMCDIPLDDFRRALMSSGLPPLPDGQQPAAELLSDDAVRAPAVGDRVVALVRDATELPPLPARFARGGRELAVERQEQLKFDGRFAVVVIYRVKN